MQAVAAVAAMALLAQAAPVVEVTVVHQRVFRGLQIQVAVEVQAAQLVQDPAALAVPALLLSDIQIHIQQPHQLWGHLHILYRADIKFMYSLLAELLLGALPIVLVLLQVHW